MNTQVERTGLSELESEMIEFFVHYAQMLSLPKSVGEIYGLLFCSPSPLSLDQVVERLHISKGSASQGIRALKQLRAIQSVYIVGTRKDFYKAETSIRRLMGGFIRERIQPELELGKEKLERLNYLVEKASESDDYLVERFEQVKGWRSKASKLLPFLAQFIQIGKE